MNQSTNDKRHAEVEARRAERGDVDTYRYLHKGDTVKIRGERGLFKFIEARVVNNECQWVVVCGGTKGHSSMRIFTFDRVIKKRKAEAR